MYDRSGANNSNYRGRDKWAEEQQGKHLCSCGCEGIIKVLPKHYSIGVPKYLQGHYIKNMQNHPMYKGVDKLIESEQGKHFCHCGCNGEITIRNVHFTNCRDIPLYLPHHMPTKGAQNPNWKGGLLSEDKIARSCAEYKDWRTAVFERDEYRCQRCNADHKLNAHHIENFSTVVDQRYIVDNGITLCESCHDEFHATWGRYNNTQEQIDNFCNDDMQSFVDMVLGKEAG